ncbi:MAG: hypothetical protein ACYC1U_04660 [Candidatus Aquicultorales bacterium]
MGHGMGHGPGYGMHGHHGGAMGGHACPICGVHHGMGMMGEAGFGPMGGGHWPDKLAKKAVKKLLIEKMKAKIDARWGDKLDAVAEEMVNMAEEKMKMKKNQWRRKKEMMEHFHEIFGEETGEEE